jgi:UDP-N-acetyl-D-mannosaminuronic acid transferase (WecB/TagA/CpsF family)
MEARGREALAECDAKYTAERNYQIMLNSADLLLVADGMPLVCLGRCQGHAMRRRVYGPELMETFCRKTGPLYQHYFYGGGPGVADRLAEILKQLTDWATGWALLSAG